MKRHSHINITHLFMRIWSVFAISWLFSCVMYANNNDALQDNSAQFIDSANALNASRTPSNIAYNGKIFIAHSSGDTPLLHIDGRSIAWLPHPRIKGEYIALVPISYHTPPSTITLASNLTLIIQKAPYKQESITITNKQKVFPDTALQKRIEQERDEALNIYSSISKKRYWRTPFAYPVKDVFITSPYGSARVFNEKVQSYHSGVDFRAHIGVPIYAANDGVVRLAKERVLSGNGIILDHGEGIYTTYFHASKLLVKAGQIVRKGQKIALSGDTGRVSGAHLHFGVMCNGISIDPIDFFTQINALFAQK